MARTVVAIYDNFQTANEAVRELVDSGFPRDNISVIANNQRGEFGTTNTNTTTNTTPTTTHQTDNVAEETGSGAGVGAGIGAAIGGIGGLLIGLGALTIPGIGPVIAAGPLAVALSTLTGAGVGAVAGGVTGGLLGALVGLGIPEEEAGFYAEGVRRGGVLVTVQADEYNTDQITSILNRHDPVDINNRADQWRTEGWTGYDPNARTAPTTRSDEFSDPNMRTDQSTMNQGTGMMDQDRDMMDRDRNRTDRDYTGTAGTTRTDSDMTDRNRMDQGMGTSGMSNQGTGGMNQQGMGSSGMGNQGTGGMNQQGMGSSGMGNQGTGGMNQQGMGQYEGFNPEYSGYRTFYDTYLFDSGQPYSYYVPAYRYGYSLRNDPRYQGRDWNMVESQVRMDWERDNPGTWDRMKNAVRHAWETIVD